MINNELNQSENTADVSVFPCQKKSMLMSEFLLVDTSQLVHITNLSLKLYRKNAGDQCSKQNQDDCEEIQKRACYLSKNLVNLTLSWKHFQYDEDYFFLVVKLLAHLPNLLCLDLNNFIVGKDLDSLSLEISQLTNLQTLTLKLNLRNKQKSEFITLSKSLQKLENLHNLNLEIFSDSSKSDQSEAMWFSDGISKLKHLKQINVQINQEEINELEEECLTSAFSQLINLESLCYDLNLERQVENRTNKLFSGLQNLPKLSKLNLKTNQLRGFNLTSISPAISHLLNLQHLELQLKNLFIDQERAKLLQSAFSTLTKLTNLFLDVSFDLRQSESREQLFCEAISKAVNLTDFNLKIGMCFSLQFGNYLSAALKNMVNLKSLCFQFEQYSELSVGLDEVYEILPSHLPFLSSLHLDLTFSQAAKIKTKTLCAALLQMGQLSNLFLHLQTDSLKFSCIQEISNVIVKLSNLENLIFLFYSETFGQSSLAQSLAKELKLPKLTSLNLGQGEDITQKNRQTILKNNPRLVWTPKPLNPMDL